MKRLSFITQFKIEILILLTHCRKVLGKMPVNVRSVYQLQRQVTQKGLL